MQYDGKMSSTRLQLRRVMYNPNRANTRPLSKEEHEKTIISLQGGKKFGRAGYNDIVFFGDSEDMSKTASLISRNHAEIYHSTSGDSETYYVADLRSENGTYLNGLRLPNDKRTILKNGDTIKFGHKNGRNVAEGEKTNQTDAEFAFAVEVATTAGNSSKVCVFANTPVSRLADTLRMPSEVATSIVHRQEADSTNGTPEANGSDDALGQTPGTSQSLNLDAKTKAPHTTFFTFTQKHIAELCLSAGRDQIFARRNSKLGDVLKKMFPDVSTEIRLTVIRMEEFVSSFESTVVLIDEMCRVLESQNETKTSIEELKKIRNDVALFFCDKEKFTKAKEEAKQQDERQAVLRDADSSGTEAASADVPSPSRSSPAVRQSHPIVVPTPNNISKEEFHRQIAIQVASNGITQATVDLFAILAPGLANAALISANPTLANFHNHIEILLRTLESQRVVGRLPSMNQGVIATAGNPRQPARDAAANSVPVVTLDSSSEVDEERHSASSGSTRRRTESEESEIVDVVTPDADEPQPMDDENVVDMEPEAEKRSTVQQVSPTDGLNNRESGTPSSNIAESEAVKKNVEGEKKIGAVSDVLRTSMTPRIDGQAASSAVISPINSPLSRPAPAESASPTMVGTSTEARQLVKNVEEQMAKAVAAVEEENDIQEEHVENGRKSRKTEEKKKMKKAQEAAAVSAEDDGEEQRPSKSAVVDRKKENKKETPRRMKQLGGSSGDSDSDDDEKKTKNVRRSTRRVKSPPKRTQKKPTEVETDEPEEDEESTSKARGARGTNKLKRASNSGGRGRKSKAAEQEEQADDDEPPKKRRGRKKAVVREESESLEGTDDSEEVSEKEQCGVPSEFCLCPKPVEQGKSLAWVACNDCGQWFHVWCLRLQNKNFTPDEMFRCCGPNANGEASAAILGRTFEKYQNMARKPALISLPKSQMINS